MHGCIRMGDHLSQSQSRSGVAVGLEFASWSGYIIRYSVASYGLVSRYKITYSVATLSYDNYYVNLRDYSNSILSGLL